MHWCLHLGQGSKLRSIVFEIQVAEFIFVDDSVQPTYWYVDNSDFSFMASSKSNAVRVGKVDDMQLPLSLAFTFISIYLSCFYNHIVLLWLVNFENTVLLASNLVSVLEFEFAQLTVEGFPGVCSNMCSELFVFSSRSPLLKTLEMHKFHTTRTFARWKKWILLTLVFFKTYPADIEITIIQALLLTFFVVCVIRYYLDHIVLLRLQDVNLSHSPDLTLWHNSLHNGFLLMFFFLGLITDWISIIVSIRSSFKLSWSSH